MLRGKRVALGQKEREWVEYGFARFGYTDGSSDMEESAQDMEEGYSDIEEGANDVEEDDSNMEDGHNDTGEHASNTKEVIVYPAPIFDEPLIMLAADHHLSHTPLGLDHIAVQRLDESSGRGTSFEESIGVYFSKAFGPDVRLCDIFHFGLSTPRWARIRGVQLVALSRGRFLSIDRSRWVGCPLPLCRRLHNGEDTVNWFKDPSSTMCFPDTRFGPDLVFFVRVPYGEKGSSSFIILCVIVQAKYRSDERVTHSVQEEAISTLSTSQFYKRKVNSFNACPHKCF
jgi:hypothetical protein